MATISLKIAIANQSMIDMTFEEGMKVCDVCHRIHKRVAGTTASRLSNEYSLFKPDEDPTKAMWLEQEKTLKHYHFKSGDVLEYRTKPFQIRVRTLDSSFNACLNVDDTLTVAKITRKVCSDIELPNPEEFSFTAEQKSVESANRRSINPWKQRKMTKRKKKLHTEDQLNWLDPEKSPREQGVKENSVLTLRKKIYFPDSAIGCNDSIQLNLQYEQAKRAILNGTHPVTLYVAIQLAALQWQVQYGNNDETRLKIESFNLEEYLPKSHSKVEGIKHDIVLESQQLCHCNELEAKYKYCELYESIQTYGVAYFLVKEQLHGKNKLVPCLLGISCKGIMRMDRKTKEIRTTWLFTTAVRRWAFTTNSFKLIYGSNCEEYLVQTTEGEAISQLISSYIDIRESNEITPNIVPSEQSENSSRSDNESFTEPPPRYMHFFGTIKHQLCVYGGAPEEMSSAIHSFNNYTEIWQALETQEHPADILYDGACITVGRHLYLYGGYNGQQCQGTLYKLDVETLKWEKLVTGSDSDSRSHPLPKRGSRMIYHDNKLWLFGGYSSQGWTNEFHSYDLQRNSWARVATQGPRPPPCSDFSFTMIDDHRAILFGGRQEETYFKHVYRLEFSTILRWSKCEVDTLFPQERSHHVGVCLGLGGNYPQLLIISGKNADNILSDAWLLNVNSGQWREIQNGTRSLLRWGHSAIASTLSPRITEVVVFGGAASLDGSSVLSKTTLLKLKYLDSTNEWIVMDTAVGSQLSSPQRFTAKKTCVTTTSIDDINAAVRKNESITRKHAQALCIGPRESGKTSFLKRLLKSQSHFSASPVINGQAYPSMFYSVSVLDSDTWKEVEFEKSIVEQIQEFVYILQQKKSEPNTSVVGTFPSPATSSQMDSDSDIDMPVVLKANPAPSSTIDGNIRQVITSVLPNYGGYVEKNNIFLYLKDVGSELKIQDMSSFLVSGPSIIFFVFRADVDFTSSINLQSTSIEDTLIYFLASLYSVAKLRKHSFSGPFVLLVATHKNKLGRSVICKLNEHLKFLIKEGGFSDLVFCADRSKDQVLFAVDNTSDSDDDFKAIRATIYNLINSRNEFSTTYPISYLLFCLELQNDQRSIFTLEECKSIAEKYNLVGDQVNDLLHFLHTLIGVFYYLDELKILMKYPGDFFCWVNERLLSTSSHNGLSMKETYDLEKKGILTSAAFASVAGTYKGSITASEILKVLTKNQIAAKLQLVEEGQYFFPCLLSKSAKDDRKTDVAPLFIKFTCNHCPKGLLGVLIAHLMTPQATQMQSSGISLTHKDDQIFCNQVSFTVKSSERPYHQNELTLSFNSFHIEVSFNEGASDFCDTCSSICSEIRIIIIESIKRSLTHLQSKTKPLLYVECVRCSQLHHVEEGTGHNVVVCQELHKTISVPSRAAYWWDKTQADRQSTLQARKRAIARLPGLTMKNHFAITKYLEPMSNTEVIALGGRLGLSYPDLCKMPSPVAGEMVAAWLNEKYNVASVGHPSWSNLTTALNDIGHSGIAEKIQSEIELPEFHANTL